MSERSPADGSDPVLGAAVDQAAPDVLNDVTVADVYTVSNGQVVRMQAYADPAEAPAAGD